MHTYKESRKEMEVANNWKDYEILDMADGEKLER